MEVELHKLAAHYVKSAFEVVGVYHYSIPPGQKGTQITAPFPGYIFPLAGQAQFYFEGTPYLAKPGHVIHGGANMMVEKQVVGSNKWEYILVLYSINKPEPPGLTLEKTHFELAVGQSPRLAGLLQRLSKTADKPGAIPAFQTETIFRCILEEMFVCVQNQTSGSDRLLFEKATDYIHEYYMDALTVRGLAQMHGVNENRLFYVFTKYAAMGPSAYLTAHRLNRAKELLITGDAPILSVAKSVGFADPYHFSRTFKRQFGLSPSGFRSKFRNRTGLA